MIQHLSWSITNLFIGNKTISEEDGDIYAFGFECMLATAVQICILFAVGLIFRCLIQITIFTIAFTQIKKYIGGWHANTHFTCIFGYTVMALISIYLCSIFPSWISYILLAVSLFFILAFAPVQHKNNPKTEEETTHARKVSLLTATIITVCICVILLSPLANYAIYGAGGLFVASLSLIIPNKEI